MPTAAERQALLFLAAVALVGGGVRVVAATRFEKEIKAGQGSGGARSDGTRLLASQIAAIDSARSKRRGGSRPAASAKARSPRASRDPTLESAVTKPTPDRRSSSRAQQPTLSRGGRSDPPGPIDVNSASASQLEELPRVGPALARRIVEYREAHGSFASIDDLRHVRGIGVTTASLLAPLVTFSSGYRPIQSERRPIRRDPAARDH
jgi:competence ComEA-like helix-hairpin-helix protein